MVIDPEHKGGFRIGGSGHQAEDPLDQLFILKCRVEGPGGFQEKLFRPGLVAIGRHNTGKVEGNIDLSTRIVG